MPSTDTLLAFCFAHESICLIPAEHLGEAGLAGFIADPLLAPGRLSGRQLQCLQRALVLHWRRARELSAKAPASWFAPRQTNLLIATDAQAVPPYFDPFAGTSSLLYLSDLDTNAEYVAYLLVHNARLSQMRSLRAALICNLSYWLVLDEDSRLAFRRGAAEARRPDAQVFQSLADSLEWIQALCHHPLKPPTSEGDESWLRVDEAALFVPRRLQSSVMALCADAEASLHRALQVCAPARWPARVTASVPAGSPVLKSSLDGLCDWVERCRAHLIVHTEQGATVWSPEETDTRALRRALQHASEDAIESLQCDLQVVHARSRTFLDALLDPTALPRHCAVLEAGDGAYLDAARQAVVYELRQPGFNACEVAAPPYHRLLLGARVMHEWGHLAHGAKILRLKETCEGRYLLARAELGRQFMRIVSSLPRRLRGEVLDELHSLAPDPHDWPAALARKTLSRVGDYLANLLCSRLLPFGEMQAYVRANVRSHLAEDLGLVGELARYAHEVQYLALAGLPRNYFYAVTPFENCFVHSGVLSLEDAEALFDATARVFACYGVDGTRLALPASEASDAQPARASAGALG